MSGQPLHPGPLDGSVLTLQATHRSEAVWSDTDIPDEAWHAYHCETPWRSEYTGHRDIRVLQYIARAGFYGLLQVGFMRLDGHLIRAMVERWREETHTFHLPVGEATITLQDVEMLLGLPVDGTCITDYISTPTDEEELQQICLPLLGFEPSDLKGSRMKQRYLTDFIRLNPLDDDSPDQLVRQHTRCLLMLLIHLVLGDKSGNLIDLQYLRFIDDLDVVGSYSWGSAVLAFLYRSLCMGARIGCRGVAGASLLVQIWAWSRISCIRPQLGHPEIVDPLRLGLGPAAVYWTRATRDHTRVPTHSVIFFRDQLDQMRPEHMTWEPYRELDALPAYCSAGRDIYLYKGPLICFHIVELHAPDRVLRQFGFRQDIPQSIDTCRALHAIDRRGKKGTRWHVRHRRHIETWDARRAHVIGGEEGEEMTHSHPYLGWFRSITRRVIGRVAVPPPESGSQPVAGVVHSSVHRYGEIGTTAYTALGDPGRQYDPQTGSDLRRIYERAQEGAIMYGAPYMLPQPVPYPFTYSAPQTQYSTPTFPTMSSQQFTTPQYAMMRPHQFSSHQFHPYAQAPHQQFQGTTPFSSFPMVASQFEFGGGSHRASQPPIIPTQDTPMGDGDGDGDGDDLVDLGDDDLHIHHDPTHQQRPRRTRRRPACGTGGHRGRT